MIAYIKGKIISKDSNSVIIENNGIGYEVNIPLSTFYNLPENQEEVSLYIYSCIKDDTISLFGFYSLIEKRIFLMLISVSGIGPRLALNILSGIGTEDLLNAIGDEDIDRLCKIPGVGRKIAKRLVLELKEKTDSFILDTEIKKEKKEDEILKDAISALVNLGYPLEKAKKVVKEVLDKINISDLETLIKESLRVIAESL